uniref:Uncharacterized protein n=1 Tax=Romanomermis culicivorax TaxID=13658 RepID=A0A915LB11_ROMCU
MHQEKLLSNLNAKKMLLKIRHSDFLRAVSGIVNTLSRNMVGALDEGRQELGPGIIVQNQCMDAYM